MLCEDDAYVRDPAAVDFAFAAIEEGLTDIVGSPRHEDYASSPLSDNWPRYPADSREDGTCQMLRSHNTTFTAAREFLLVQRTALPYPSRAVKRRPLCCSSQVMNSG